MTPHRSRSREVMDSSLFCFPMPSAEVIPGSTTSTSNIATQAGSAGLTEDQVHNNDNVATRMDCPPQLLSPKMRPMPSQSTSNVNKAADVGANVNKQIERKGSVPYVHISRSPSMSPAVCLIVSSLFFPEPRPSLLMSQANGNAASTHTNRNVSAKSSSTDKRLDIDASTAKSLSNAGRAASHDVSESASREHLAREVSIEKPAFGSTREVEAKDKSLQPGLSMTTCNGCDKFQPMIYFSGYDGDKTVCVNCVLDTRIENAVQSTSVLGASTFGENFISGLVEKELARVREWLKNIDPYGDGGTYLAELTRFVNLKVKTTCTRYLKARKVQRNTSRPYKKARKPWSKSKLLIDDGNSNKAAIAGLSKLRDTSDRSESSIVASTNSRKRVAPTDEDDAEIPRRKPALTRDEMFFPEHQKKPAKRPRREEAPISADTEPERRSARLNPAVADALAGISAATASDFQQAKWPNPHSAPAMQVSTFAHPPMATSYPDEPAPVYGDAADGSTAHAGANVLEELRQMHATMQTQHGQLQWDVGVVSTDSGNMHHLLYQISGMIAGQQEEIKAIKQNAELAKADREELKQQNERILEKLSGAFLFGEPTI